jgi:Fusaric acid resistance protein-like
MVRSGDLAIRARLAAAAARGQRRLRGRLLAIVQTAGAAVAAWYLAVALLPDPRPAFASIAAVISVGATFGRRGHRAAQLVGGVVLGLSLASVLVHLIGAGPPQIGIMVVLAMTVAVLLRGSDLLVVEAAVSAILLIALDPGTSPGFSPNRILEALIGGGVALAVGGLLFPPDPALLVARALHAVFGELGRTLERLAEALALGDAAGAERALAAARGIDRRVDALDDALATGRETARLAPPRRAARREIDRYGRTLAQIDFAVRDTRVLARHTLRWVRRGEPAPEGLAEAVAELAAAVWALAAAYDDPREAAEVRRLAVRAAGRATAVHEHGRDLALTEIVGQVRSTAVDLVRAAELAARGPEPLEALPTEELLAEPAGEDAVPAPAAA